MASNCRSCEAEIRWAKHHESGNRMPLEEATEEQIADGRGLYRIRDEVDGPTAYPASAEQATGMFPVQLYISHFATCPDAETWRQDEPEAKARTTDPETSHAAAESLSADDLRDSQADVLLFFNSYQNGMTDEEFVDRALSAGMSQSRSGLRTRRSELVDLGLMEDAGERRETRSGREAIVWRVTDAGRTVCSTLEYRSQL